MAITRFDINCCCHLFNPPQKKIAMLFTTDKQTQEDLNIYGKQGTDSILSLFNRTSTVHGSKLLVEMFRYPLSDADAINARSENISYLSRIKAVFPFSSEQFDRAEQYLANTDERTKLSSEKPTLEKKLSNLVASNADYKQIVNGINALMEIIQELHSLLKNMLLLAGSPLKNDPETQGIYKLVTTEPINQLVQENPPNKLPHEKLAAYDLMLRFRYRDIINQILQYIYKLDVYLTVAKIANERNLVFPKALPKEEHVIRIAGFYHPQLKNAVANKLTINTDSNVVFLTGANMAGKSTFMKSLGIAMYLAHMGFPVAAKQMEFSVMDGIYTTINLPDNLGIGASHFYAEVLRIKKIAKELSTGKNIFVIFDELFRGTNVKDAYEATIAVTAAFAKKRNSVFVISTHIIEAGEVLKEQANISFKYLPTRMNGTNPEYTYTLESGITDDRHGMIIINNEGILELLKKRKGAVQ
jgi:DNA mismatch repair protein MutS